MNPMPHPSPSMRFLRVCNPATGRERMLCHDPGSGDVYETTLVECSCPEFRQYLRPLATPCRHSLALLAAYEDGLVLDADWLPPSARPAA